MKIDSSMINIIDHSFEQQIQLIIPITCFAVRNLFNCSSLSRCSSQRTTLIFHGEILAWPKHGTVFVKFFARPGVFYATFGTRAPIEGKMVLHPVSL